MNTDILNILDVDVIYAVETGSRVLGMASPTSDYDVRFIFKYPMRRYLAINRPRDYIRLDAEGYDLVGYDIYKFASLFLKSNMEVLEWCITDHILYDSGTPLMRLVRKLMKDDTNYDRSTIVRHCLGHCDSLVTKKLIGDVYNVKFVLAAANKLMQAYWMARGGNMAVMTVRERLLLDRLLPERVKIEIEQFLRLRRAGIDEVWDSVTVDWLLDNYANVRDSILDMVSDITFKQKNKDIVEGALYSTIRG